MIHSDIKIMLVLFSSFLLFTKWQILDSFKLKEFADNNFIFDENGRKLSNG